MTATSTLEYIINHVILPPQLPQEAESKCLADPAETELLTLLCNLLDEYLRERQKYEGPSIEVYNVWTIIHTMLCCPSLRPVETFSPQSLVKCLKTVEKSGQ